MNYPSFRTQYFRGRRGYYLDRNSYLQNQGDDPPTLTAYLTVYRLLRAEAGLRVYEDDTNTVRLLANLRDHYQQELRRNCGSDGVLLAQLCAAKDAIVSVEVETNAPDEADYMQLFHYTMKA